MASDSELAPSPSPVNEKEQLTLGDSPAFVIFSEELTAQGYNPQWALTPASELDEDPYDDPSPKMIEAWHTSARYQGEVKRAKEGGPAPTLEPPSPINRCLVRIYGPNWQGIHNDKQVDGISVELHAKLVPFSAGKFAMKIVTKQPTSLTPQQSASLALMHAKALSFAQIYEAKHDVMWKKHGSYHFVEGWKGKESMQPRAPKGAARQRVADDDDDELNTQRQVPKGLTSSSLANASAKFNTKRKQ